MIRLCPSNNNNCTFGYVEIGIGFGFDINGDEKWSNDGVGSADSNSLGGFNSKVSGSDNIVIIDDNN